VVSEVNKRSLILFSGSQRK